MDAFISNQYDIRSVLRVLFTSDFFKNAQFARVKSPAELIAGTVRLAGGHRFPEVAMKNLAAESVNMGQALLDPPSVEGWHTGKEWINTANLARRADCRPPTLSLNPWSAYSSQPCSCHRVLRTGRRG